MLLYIKLICLLIIEFAWLVPFHAERRPGLEGPHTFFGLKYWLFTASSLAGSM